MRLPPRHVYVIIPTARSIDFLRAWGNAFADCHLIIVEDRHEPQLHTDGLKVASVHHFTWEDIDNDFGKDSWIISRKSAGIRTYGFWKAYRMGADFMITLDDDCYPIEDNFVEQHLQNLRFRAASGWFATYPHPRWMYSRGFPYSVRNTLPVVISHGLWSGALDLDAKVETRLSRRLKEQAYPPIRQVIPFGYFYPMCTMNLAFQRVVTPLMYLPLMGSDPMGKHWKYQRFDDIWAGIFSKKILDHLGMTVVNGSPFVEHRKASHPHINLRRELSGMRVHEKLWKCVRDVQLTCSTPLDCYKELASKIQFPQEEYFRKLKQAMATWVGFF